jgi:1-deoxy-D-xylulose-5-phosphate reductoisomerase
MADRIGFYDISELVERVCSTFSGRRIPAPATVADALSIDQEARKAAWKFLPARLVATQR